MKQTCLSRIQYKNWVKISVLDVWRSRLRSDSNVMGILYLGVTSLLRIKSVSNYILSYHNLEYVTICRDN